MAKAEGTGQRTEKTARRLKTATYKHFRLTKRIKHPARPVSGSWRLLKKSFGLLLSRPKLYGGIVLIYGLLTILLVKGLSGGVNVSELKGGLNAVFSGHFSGLATSLTLFALLISANGSSASEAGSAYQAILTIVISLALIWALRQTSANKKVNLKAVFYSGMYPLIPFILVLLVIGLQLVPLLVGNTLFSLVISTGVAATALEKMLWGLIFALLAIFSLYMIGSSIFALYIVTLPNMTPLKALRSARQLVLHRRFMVWRRLILLPALLLILALIIMLPVILYIPAVAQWLLFILSMLVLAIVHAYIYTLYRELL